VTLSNRVLRLTARSSENGVETKMLIVGQAEQAEMRREAQSFLTQSNVEGLPDSYQGLRIIRVNARALLMVGNVTVEQ
jgi:hypothetical protein